MNKDTATGLLPFVKALGEGKTIQILRAGYGWTDFTDEIGFILPVENYRIKPEVREWWILESPAQVLNYKPANPMFIHVREVLKP